MAAKNQPNQHRQRTTRQFDQSLASNPSHLSRTER
jgi:hypothetical protein